MKQSARRLRTLQGTAVISAKIMIPGGNLRGKRRNSLKGEHARTLRTGVIYIKRRLCEDWDFFFFVFFFSLLQKDAICNLRIRRASLLSLGKVSASSSTLSYRSKK